MILQCEVDLNLTALLKFHQQEIRIQYIHKKKVLYYLHTCKARIKQYKTRRLTKKKKKTIYVRRSILYRKFKKKIKNSTKIFTIFTNRQQN